MATNSLAVLSMLQSSSTSIPMELIDQEDQLPDVIQLLRKETQLSVDCEGVDLGRFGELCLVQVATTQKVYLFDVVVLGRKIFDQGKLCYQSSGCINIQQYIVLLAVLYPGVKSDLSII